MRVKARKHVRMKGLDGSNPPLSATQSSKLDRLRAESPFRLRLLTALRCLRDRGFYQGKSSELPR